jgi:transcriptional regulator with XRE-family HTH domain
MDVVAIFGKNVKAERLKQELSQEELAFRAGLKRSYLSDLERGTRNPSIRVLGRIAASLDVNPGDLLSDT